MPEKNFNVYFTTFHGYTIHIIYKVDDNPIFVNFTIGKKKTNKNYHNQLRWKLFISFGYFGSNTV